MALAAFTIAVGPLSGPAFAGGQNERAGLVMSNLPPAGSKDYDTLDKLAGKSAGQTLTQTLAMTKSEMWSVPASRLDALLAAASAQGVIVTRLDAAWNHTLAPMPEGAGMTAGQKAMMAQSMESKAAMGVAMMALPQSNVMEYALTKGMDQPVRKGEPAPKIVIPLNGKTAVTARRTSIKSSGDGVIWRGVAEDTGEDVMLMWWPGGRLTGSVTYNGHMYAIKNMGGTLHGVVEISPEALPPEHAPMAPGTMQKMNMREDPLVKQGDASMMMKKSSPDRNTAGPERGDTRNLEDAPLEKTARVPVGGDITGNMPKRGDVAKPVTITLLVAYTKEAARHYDNIETDMIALAVEDANQSMINSGIGHVRFEVVHTHLTDYVESGSHFDHVFALLQPGDGVMDEIPKLRDAYKADVAVLIVHDPQGCGLAAKVAAGAEQAFAVVHHECAATTYSLAHEVGHLIGARHDEGFDKTADPFPYGHGFVNGTAWRTMMSYKESCNGCPRLPVWSNPAIRIKGVRAGNAKSNNARVIAGQAARVAAFR